MIALLDYSFRHPRAVTMFGLLEDDELVKCALPPGIKQQFKEVCD